MAAPGKTVLFSAVALIAAGIAAGTVHASRQLVDDAIASRIDTQKGHDNNGFVLDWAERTPPQGGRITLRGVTGRLNGRPVLAIDSADIVRSGRTVQIVGRQVRAEIDGDVRTARTVTVDGLKLDELLAALSPHPMASQPAIDPPALMNDIQIVAERIETRSAPAITIQRTEADLAGGMIRRLQVNGLQLQENGRSLLKIAGFALQEDGFSTLQVGIATAENIPLERLHPPPEISSAPGARFLAWLLDGVSFKLEQVSVEGPNPNMLSVAQMQFRFAGDLARDVQLGSLAFFVEGIRGHVASASFDRIDPERLFAVGNSTVGLAIGSGGTSDNFRINRAVFLGTEIAGFIRIGSLTFSRQNGNIFESQIRNIRIDFSSAPPRKVARISMPQIAIPEIIAHDRRRNDLLESDMVLPVQDILDLRCYYRFDNLVLTYGRVYLPDATRPGELAVNLRLEDHGLIELISATNGKSRTENALLGRTSAEMLILQTQAADTIDLPERVDAFVQNGTPLEFGLRLAFPAADARPQIRLVESDRLSLN